MPEKRGLKAKAEYIFDKFIDVYQESKKKPSSPPKPTSGVHQPSNSVNQLSASLNGLSISSPTTPAAGQTKPDFIGGFNLAGVSTSTPALSSSSGPLMMPVPCLPLPEQQSLTMQMALNPNCSTRPGYDEPVISPSPPCTPKKPSRRYSSASSPGASVATSLLPPSSPTRLHNPSTPIRPSLSSHSSASTPSTPSGKHNQVQCAGMTKMGKRCTRQVKTTFAGNNSEDEESIPHFCYQHTDLVLSPTGCYPGGTGNWVLFEDWIPAYLQKSTQASLRAEMEKVRSNKDEPGHIYTFEIRDPDAPRTIKLKVGRSVNLVKRIDQWGKQCGSKEQVLRGFYPDPQGEERSLMKGRVAADEKAVWCHRLGFALPIYSTWFSDLTFILERLIHIELADLVSTCVYLEPGWPNIEAANPTPTPSKSNSNGKCKPCPDCGSLHKEIFEFRRWEEGELNVGMEWEKIVKPVIQRWGMFVDIYV